MKYILMHKDIPVCEIEISDASFSIENVSKIYNPEHISLGLSENEKINLRKFNKWYKGRSIPASRQGLADALDIIGVTHQDELILKCYGLSLSDQYWFKPNDVNLQWKDINFFDNDFSVDVGNALFGTPTENDSFFAHVPQQYHGRMAQKEMDNHRRKTLSYKIRQRTVFPRTS